MSFNIYILCLILLQSNLSQQGTESTTDETTAETTNNFSTNLGETESNPYAEPTTYQTTESTYTDLMDTETESSTETHSTYSTTFSTIYSTTDVLSTSVIYNTNNTPYTNTRPTTEKTTEITEHSNPDITTNTIQSRFKDPDMPSAVSTIPEDIESNEQELTENNRSTVNVFGIVLASILCSIGVFYVIQALIKKYRGKSYIVRSPSMELGRA